MRFFLIIFSACLLAFLATFNGPAFSQLHTGYCDSVKSTADALECVNRHKKDVQDELNVTYKDLYDAQEDQAVKDLLAESQKSWRAYRDAQCGWEAGMAENPSLQKVYELSCITAMTDLRKSLLTAVVEREEQEAPREFSSQPRWMNALAHEHPDIYWRYGDWSQADLDCDGEKEQIMSGLYISQIQDAVNLTDEKVSEETHHEVEMVVAIAENPTTGKPKTSLLRFPVSETVEGDRAHLCRSSITMTIEEEKKKPEALVTEQENAERAAASDEEKKVCGASLLITDRLCQPIVVTWRDNVYVTTQLPAVSPSTD